MTKQSRLLRTHTRPQFFPLLLPSTEHLVSMKILKTLSINLTPYPSILPSNFDMKPYWKRKKEFLKLVLILIATLQPICRFVISSSIFFVLFWENLIRQDFIKKKETEIKDNNCKWKQPSRWWILVRQLHYLQQTFALHRPHFLTQSPRKSLILLTQAWRCYYLALHARFHLPKAIFNGA